MLRCGAERVHVLNLSLVCLPLVALLLLAAVLGTDGVGRPLTDDEKKRFGALLREHDYPGARLVALRFAYKLTRSRVRAQDLMGRADLRLVTSGWDPREVPLVKRLCRLVWSEWTHAGSESETARKAEEGFVRELEVTEGLKVSPPMRPRTDDESKAERVAAWAVSSHEQRITALEASHEFRARASAKLEKLRAAFEKAGDEVNLLWLKFELQGVTDLHKMAEASGRAVAEFYAAAKRRQRTVQRLLASEQGVEWVEEQS